MNASGITGTDRGQEERWVGNGIDLELLAERRKTAMRIGIREKRAKITGTQYIHEQRRQERGMGLDEMIRVTSTEQRGMPYICRRTDSGQGG
jgi:hypothetical protein